MFGRTAAATQGFGKMENFMGKGPTIGRTVGDWIRGKRTGKGSFMWVNSNIYQGDFLNGKRHGEGIQWHADGNKYQDGEGS